MNGPARVPETSTSVKLVVLHDFTMTNLVTRHFPTLCYGDEDGEHVVICRQ